MKNMNSKLMMMTAVVVASAPAQATIWNFEWKKGDTGQGSAAGVVQSISSQFNTNTDRLKYSFTIAKENGDPQSDVNGFYLAMNDGPNPKGKSGELAFLYFDASNTSDLKLTAYGYRGADVTSWKDGSLASGTQAPDKILSSVTNSGWINNLNYKLNADGSATMGFDIDATLINNHTPKYPSNGVDWDGIQFDNKVGIWFGALEKAKFKYGTDGFLTDFSFKDRSYVDTSNLDAVPEPFTMAGLALAAFIARRKKKATA